LPWRNNKRYRSCIKPGCYKVKLHHSNNFDFALALKNVNRRSGILIHSGCFPENTTGCILFGESSGCNRLFDSRINLFEAGVYLVYKYFYDYLLNGESDDVIISITNSDSLNREF
jgi:hypothetical protein